MIKRKPLFLSAVAVVLTLTVLAALFYYGVLPWNSPSEKDYPVRGVDVSNWQGDIDWTVLSEQNITFAFIKATEGSSFTDKRFDENWDKATQTDLFVGAYHFFSYDSPGQSQAEHFIATVPKTENMLPPVVDIEYYGDYFSSPAERESVKPELQELLNALESHYGVKPVLYATMDSYERYLSGNYADYPIWIRDILKRPSLPDGRSWTFWQYSNRGRLDGYYGEEQYIDLNVFDGTLDEFQKLTTP